MDGLRGEISCLMQEVGVMRKELAAERQARMSHLNDMAAAVELLHRQRDDELARPERSRAYAAFMRAVAIELQCLCIQKAMDWTRRQRIDADIEGLTDFERYASEQPPADGAVLRAKLSACQVAMGIDNAALDALNRTSACGSDISLERIDKLSASEAKERLEHAVAAFPVALYSLAVDDTAELSKEVVERVAALYVAARSEA